MTSWAERVYANDLYTADVCRRMQVTGFAYDYRRAAEFSDRCRQWESDALKRCDDAAGQTLPRTETGGISDNTLRSLLIDSWRAPVVMLTATTKKPAMHVDAMTCYAAMANRQLAGVARAVLEWRRLRKIRSTYLDPIEVGADGRVHASWYNYGTVSGRFSCGDPNLMNLPKKTIDPFRKEGGIRSLYVARDGYTLVALDRKQLEMRVAAYASGDEAMMAACEGSDLHSANAYAIFGSAMNVAEYARLSALKEAGGSIPSELKDDYDRWYGLRNMAKTAGFAVCYLAEAETVHARILASGGNIKLAAVVAMLEKMKRGFAGYYRWQDERLLACVRNGWTDSPILGRRRWLGHEPSPTECANFPIQSGAADIMNQSLPAIDAAMARLDPRIRLVAQVHDNLTFEVPAVVAQDAVAELTRICHTPVALESSGRRLEAVYPIDISASERWS